MVLTYVVKNLNEKLSLNVLWVFNRKQESVLLDLVWWILKP
jgi:hypothetical protein